MIDLIYKKSKGPWPVQASAAGVSLFFSGSADKTRLQKENFRRSMDYMSRGVLWLLVAVGLLAFTFTCLQAYQSGRWELFVENTSFNLMSGIAVFALSYLWAKNKQRQILENGVNLLHWETLAEKPGSKKTIIDVFGLFNSPAKAAWDRALESSGRKTTLTAVSLFLSLLKDRTVQLLFARLDVNLRDVETILKNYTTLSPEKIEDLGALPFLAFAESVKLHNKAIDPLMLLCALVTLLPEDHIIQNIFLNIGISQINLETVAAWILNVETLQENLHTFIKLSKFKPDNEINVGLTSVPTPYLDSYATDLTRKAKHGSLPIALGRTVDLHNVFELLSEGNKGVVIKGDPGSGRATLLNELAYKMASEQVPKYLQDKRLINVEISSIVGKKDKTEAVFMRVLEEAAEFGNIVLCFRDIHQLLKTQTSSGLNLLELLVNFLEHENILVIATTTIEDYTESLRPVAGFDETFTSYELGKLSGEDILLACCIKASIFESRDDIFFRFQSIQEAVSASDLYLKGSAQPQKAISLLVEAASRAKNNKNKVITAELIQKIVSEKTHIPMQNFSKGEADKLLSLEDSMGKFVVGQREAITAIAESLRRARSGIAATGRPLASFLFLGPTGVGKTEVARTLAAVYFGEEKYLLRLDMSEYQGTDGLVKLLGGSSSKNDSELVKHIKNYPFCLLLMDEFEKADKEIQNLFLQILEDGRLTTGSGETLDITHCLIIATSNAGTNEIQTGLSSGKTLEQIKQHLYNQTLTTIFSPELLNRFDGIILFNTLSQEEIKQIAYLQLGYLRVKLIEKGIKLDFTDSVIEDISKNAYDPSFGARPIRRYIQDHIEGFIAKLLLGKQLPRGSTVTIDFKDGKLVVI